MTQTKFNILVLGSGGREHALCWKIAQSQHCAHLFCAPGNGGTASVAENVVLDATDHDGVVAFCRDHAIALVVIGPEAPLVDGLADTLQHHNIAAFGPGAAAAQLEGSKGFTKDLCAEANIPTAAYGRFNAAAPAHAYLDKQALPIVIKADGLAAGKGVIICDTMDAGHDAIDYIFDGAFGDAGAELVIEEFMTGEEASFFVLCDGTNAVPLATAQDHKRVGDADTGPNTGGMGAYSPASIMTPQLVAQTMDTIIRPTLDTMAARGTPYCGVLYAGLMLTPDGPKLVEYNCRFGDPEAQVLMMRLETDLVPALLAAAKGDLSGIDLTWSQDAALTVVMAARGYPGNYDKGTQISLDGVNEDSQLVVFHAGTRAETSGTLTAQGGRVLNVTARGKTVAQAQTKAYVGCVKIDWADGFYRKDIGWREIEREKNLGEK